MDLNVKDSQVMNFIRRDGRAGSSVCFLTIEDGGANNSEKNFLDYIGGSGVWEPGIEKRGDVGKAGRCISKIMSGLLFSDLSRSVDYIDYEIYFANEWNLKFFPIGRPGVKEWQDYYSTASGLEQNEYLAVCKELRPSIIWERYGKPLEQSKVVVILATREEWLNVLKKSEKFEFATCEIEKTGNRWKWAFYFRSDGTLAFSYFGMFNYGVSDQDVLQFSQLLRKYADNSLDGILPDMVGEFERAIVR